jgi:hypothetical protein
MLTSFPEHGAGDVTRRASEADENLKCRLKVDENWTVFS